MSMFGSLGQNDWSKEESTKSKITSNPVHTSCTHFVIISSVHTLQKQHHPAVITLQTSHCVALLWKQASTGEGWNYQSEIIPDWVNNSKTTGFHSKLMDFPLKNTLRGTSSSFIQSHNMDMAFCQMKSKSGPDINIFNMLHIQIVVTPLFLMCDQKDELTPYAFYL